jgi:succinate-semialdehyde dehydrogenase/glutarate-semialdehyde dehydrogenase
MQLNDMTLFRQQALIDGQWRDAPNGDVIAVTNPANGEQLGSVPKMGADETREAIEAANRALPAWRALTAKERANILRRWFDLMMENQDDLARLMTLEQGKPLAEAKGEISYAASFIEWFAEEGKRIYGDTIPGHQADKRLLVIKQPIGVTAAITPWNFPAAMITRKAGPALAAGCTMVLKPASQTPFSALALAGQSRRDPRRGVQRGHRLRRRGRRRTDQQPAGAQALLYRLDRDWPPADGAVRERHQKSLPGAGRQRAVYRL